MNIQEACDYAVKQLVAQGGRCSDQGVCMYGDGKSKHCAIGWLLDHSNKDLMDFEGSLADLLTVYRLDLPEVVQNNFKILKHLQAFHDQSKRHVRKREREAIASLGIDVSGEHWDAWENMGLTVL